MKKRKKEISIGIVISTYNNPLWLEKTLWGYMAQTRIPSEVIVADDGSGAETKTLIDKYRPYFSQLTHVWHPDEGFQKTRILNKALLEAKSEYLIFTDQDCIPRNDFVETHLHFAQKGYFLSGGYYKLPMSISNQLVKEDISSGKAFDLNWLRKRGLKNSFKNTKLIQYPLFASFMNTITPTRASWNGCNASGWRKDMLDIKGFDERMQYGGEDREFGERLMHLGLKGKQIRYSAITLHLDHARPYKNEDILAKNKEIREETKKNKIVKTIFGIT